MAGARLPAELAGARQSRGRAAPERRPRPRPGLAEEPHDPAVGQPQARAAPLDHPRGARVELVEPPEPYRRVERDRDRSGEDGPEEGLHEIDSGGKDQRDPLSALDAESGDPPGGPRRARGELRE